MEPGRESIGNRVGGMTLRGTVTILIYTPHAETQRPPFSNTSPEKSDPIPTGNLLPPFWELEKNPPRKME